jgi:hypothetical protein
MLLLPLTASGADRSTRRTLPRPPRVAGTSVTSPSSAPISFLPPNLSPTLTIQKSKNAYISNGRLCIKNTCSCVSASSSGFG